MEHTVQSLRKQGHKVRVTHFRDSFKYNPYNGHLTKGTYIVGKKFSDIPTTHYMSQRGGMTQVEITFVNGKTVDTTAICHKNDNYCRKTGVSTALAKVEKEIDSNINDVGEKLFQVMNKARIQQSLPIFFPPRAIDPEYSMGKNEFTVPL